MSSKEINTIETRSKTLLGTSIYLLSWEFTQATLPHENPLLWLCQKAYRSHLLCSVCFFLMLTANEHKPLSCPGWTCPSQLWVSQQKLNFMYYCGKSKSSGHASKIADFPPYYFAPTGLSLWCYLVFFLINPFEVKIYRMDLFFNIAILFIFSCPK